MNNKNEHIDITELLIKFYAGEINEDDRARVETWRDKNTDNRAEFEAIGKLWGYTAMVSDKTDINIDDEWKHIQQKISTGKGRTINLNRFLQISASIIIISALGIWLYLQSTRHIEKSGIAQVVTTQLPDGSDVTMNAVSKIKYKNGFGSGHRNIELRGEAFFSVKADKTLPFKIRTGNTIIEVVGTKFSVSNYKSDKGIRVVVTEGKVKFYKMDQPDKEIYIEAGESALFLTQNEKFEQQQKNDLNEMAWITRKIDFNNTKLSDVARILKKTYYKDFVVDENIINCAVTVSFEDLELDLVLKVLKETLNLNITQQDDAVIIKGEKCTD